MFSYVDEKSDKFWRVETLANALVLNWGKTGTAGRYDIKEFASAEICLEQAEKLLVGKLKKGYQEMPDFDLNNHLYFDIADWGPHRLTSHPLFRQYFADDLYYDCGLLAAMRETTLCGSFRTFCAKNRM